MATLKAVVFDMDDTLLSINLSAFIGVFALEPGEWWGWSDPSPLSDSRDDERLRRLLSVRAPGLPRFGHNR